MNKIIERIEQEAGAPGLADLLAERLSPTDLQSLLMEVSRRRSAGRQPAELMAAYEKDRFAQPATSDPRRLAAWERTAFESLPDGFEAVALSPVCPLGTSSIVSATPQDWVISTMRGGEVVSDSTNVLALECARRRKAQLRANPKSAEIVELAASHRLARAQTYHNPRMLPHFHLIALASAGRDQGTLRFEIGAMARHIRFTITALRAFLGPDVPIRVTVSDFSPDPHYPRIEAELFGPLREAFTKVEFIIDAERTRARGYYQSLCMLIHAADRSGQMLELADGGSTDWTQKLMGNAKERLMISGIGSERVCGEF